MQVVWDDSIMRLFVVPTGSRPLGLLFRANKGQVDFEGALGEGDTGETDETAMCCARLLCWGGVRESMAANGCCRTVSRACRHACCRPRLYQVIRASVAAAVLEVAAPDGAA